MPDPSYDKFDRRVNAAMAAKSPELKIKLLKLAGKTHPTRTAEEFMSACWEGYKGEIEEGMTMNVFKQQRSRQKQKEKRAADKIAPNRRVGIHADKASPERAARHRANVDPDFEGNDERNYPGGKLRAKKVRKAKALGELDEMITLAAPIVRGVAIASRVGQAAGRAASAAGKAASKVKSGAKQVAKTVGNKVASATEKEPEAADKPEKSTVPKTPGTDVGKDLKKVGEYGKKAVRRVTGGFASMYEPKESYEPRQLLSFSDFRQISTNSRTDEAIDASKYGKSPDQLLQSIIDRKKLGGQVVKTGLQKANEDVNKTIEEVAAWQRKEGKNPTGGLNAKGRASARAQGHNLKPPVTTPPSELNPDSKAAKRRKSFCARMGGMPGPMKDEKGRPTRKALSLRKWNC